MAYLAATEADARAELQILVAYNKVPVLSSTEIDLLLTKARRIDASGNAPDAYSERKNLTAYALNTFVVPLPRNGHFYKVTTAGTTASAQPTFTTVSGGITTDGSVVWVEQGLAAWAYTWDLYAAAAIGWRWKAGYASNYIKASADGQSYDAGQIYDHCMLMAAEFEQGINTTVIIPGRLSTRLDTFNVLDVLAN